MSNSSASPSARRTCPCKQLPLCLSSFTAAEYGDAHHLQVKWGENIANRVDPLTGITPLVLAAQHNHVSATRTLLQLGCSVNGVVVEPEHPGDCYDQPSYSTSGNSGVVSRGFATPLHRAAFSGAAASMRILMDHPDCNLLARDFSFGDGRTPLHKAAAGGRPLAVQLLFQALRARKGGRRTDNHGSDAAIENNLLYEALTMKDSYGQTPLQVAQALEAKQDCEQASVARWDEVAGGVARWDVCANLLAYAEKECMGSVERHPQTTETVFADHNLLNNTLAPLPTHLTTNGVFNSSTSVPGCIDCGDTKNDGPCRTTSWQAAFQVLLGNSVDQTLSRSQKTAMINKTVEVRADVHHAARSEASTSKPPDFASVASSNTGLATSGISCRACGKQTIALYSSTSLGLICKACRKGSTR